MGCRSSALGWWIGIGRHVAHHHAGSTAVRERGNAASPYPGLILPNSRRAWPTERVILSPRPRRPAVDPGCSRPGEAIAMAMAIRSPPSCPPAPRCRRVPATKRNPIMSVPAGRCQWRPSGKSGPHGRAVLASRVPPRQ
jgi:hypothetical protein